jgi:hypothetical protein
LLTWVNKPVAMELPEMSENKLAQPGTPQPETPHNLAITFDKENVSPSKARQTIDLTFDDDDDEKSTTNNKAQVVEID